MVYGFCGLNIEMSPRYDLLKSRLEKYRAQGQPDIVIVPRDGDLPPAPEGVSADLWEYVCTGSLFYRRLPDFGGVMLHASCITIDGLCYLFSAPPGTGKSTHAEAWVRLYGASYVNDDKPALMFKNGRLFACGTPFSGKTDKNENVILPVGGIAVLRRGEQNEICPMSAKAALPQLYDQTVHVRDPRRLERTLEILDKVCESAPIWLLKCTPTDDAARLSHDVMTAKKGEVI